jgi:hypothetical protein
MVTSQTQATKRLPMGNRLNYRNSTLMCPDLLLLTLTL